MSVALPTMPVALPIYPGRNVESRKRPSSGVLSVSFPSIQAGFRERASQSSLGRKRDVLLWNRIHGLDTSEIGKAVSSNKSHYGSIDTLSPCTSVEDVRHKRQRRVHRGNLHEQSPWMFLCRIISLGRFSPVVSGGLGVTIRVIVSSNCISGCRIGRKLNRMRCGNVRKK